MWRSRRELQDRAGRFLMALGSSPSQVASSLLEARVAGTPGKAEHCAVAVYLGAVIGAEPAVSSVMVGTHRLYLHLENRRRPVRVPLPAPVRGMIEAFDSQLYPALIRPAAGSPQRVDGAPSDSG